MRKVVCIFVGFFLMVGFTATQENQKIIDQGIRIVEVLEEETGMSTQILKADKPRVQVLDVYPVPDDIAPIRWIKAVDYDYLNFYVEFTAVFNSNVRFHFIWTGPEFYSFTTDWISATYKVFGFYYLISYMSDWKKGTYSLVVVAEQKIPGSGAECLGETVFRIF